MVTRRKRLLELCTNWGHKVGNIVMNKCFSMRPKTKTIELILNYKGGYKTRMFLTVTPEEAQRIKDSFDSGRLENLKNCMQDQKPLSNLEK